MNNVTPGLRMLGTLPLVIAIASICHEANRAYCKTLGDNSQPAWDDAPEWQKQSAIKGVVFHLENPDASPSHSHDCWLKEKEEAGWKYGPVKDPEKKEHPCFVPYEQLPREQQLKDYLFKAIVGALNPDTEHVFGCETSSDDKRAMRAKLQIGTVTQHQHGCDTLKFHGVCASKYPEDGSDENNTFAKFSPYVNLEMNVANPALLGKFKPGQTFYVDFTEVVKTAEV